MPEEILDAKSVEETTDGADAPGSESSTDQTQPADASAAAEPDKSESPSDRTEAKDEEPRVPYGRFQEVNDKLKETQLELAKITGRIETLSEIKEKRELTVEEKQELQAQEWVRKVVSETLEKEIKPLKEQLSREQAVSAELKSINERFDAIKRADTSINDAAEEKIISLISEYGLRNTTDPVTGKVVHAVDHAYRLYKQLALSMNKDTKAKADAPTMPQSGRSGDGQQEPIDVSGKSMYEIAEEAKRQYGLS